MIGNVTDNSGLKQAIALLENDNLAARRVGVKNLCYVAGYAKVNFSEALPALTKALTDSDAYIREIAAHAIAKAAEFNVQIPDETVNALRNMIKSDANQGARENAQEALIACGRLERRIDASARQLDLFVPRSMGEAHALLMRMQRTTPRPVRQATA